MVVLPEDLGLIPSTHLAAHGTRGSEVLFWLLQHCTQIVHKHTYKQNTNMHKVKLKLKGER